MSYSPRDIDSDRIDLREWADKYIASQQKRVGTFVKWYEEISNRDSDYPLMQLEEDWLEQYEDW